MPDGAVVEERQCPACDRTLRDRGARWCGSCGALLEPPTVASSKVPIAPRRRWQVGAVVAAVAVAATAIAAQVGSGITRGFIDRGTSGTTTVADLEVTLPDEDTLESLESLERRRPPATTAPTCSRAPRGTCFLWTTEVDDAPPDVPLRTSAVVADGRVISVGPQAGAVTARDVRDGWIIWSVRGHDTTSGVPPQVAGDLVLHPSEDGLIGRAAATGLERWRNPALTGFKPYRASRHGAIVLLVGNSHGLAATGDVHRGPVLAGMDAATGKVLWHHSGHNATLAGDGAGVLITDDGQLQAYEPDGRLRWDVDVELDPHVLSEVGVWSAGPAVQVFTREYRDLRRLRDGAPMPLDGALLAGDGEHALAVELHARDAGGHTMSDTVVLLDEDGEVWRRDDVLPGGCPGSARLERATVEIITCDGERLQLDRSDGRERSRTPATDPRGDAAHGSMIDLGPYELRRSFGSGGPGDLVVRDRRSATEVARFPRDTWPVLTTDGRSSSYVTDGVLVLQSQNWLSALELPPDGG